MSCCVGSWAEWGLGGGEVAGHSLAPASACLPGQICKVRTRGSPFPSLSLGRVEPEIFPPCSLK